MSHRSFQTALFFPRFAWAAALAVGALLTAGCSDAEVSANEKASVAANGAPGAEKRGQVGSGRPGQGGMGQGGMGRGPGGAPPAVITARVQEAEFSAAVEALGTAKANEAIDITAKSSNRVTAIHFREGQAVTKGQVLIELDADEARADLQVAESALGDSRSQVNRSRELAATKALSAQQMEQLEATMQANEARVAAAKARLNDLIIRAPFSGRVGLRNVSVGGIVGPGAVITTLDDTSVMKLDFSVPETVLQSLDVGLLVEAKSAAYSDQVFQGRVLTVGTRVDPVTRAVTVRAQVPNRDGKLKPGMFMTVRLLHGKGKTLVLPEQALVPERDKQFVFGVRDGKARKTEIVVGRRRPGEVEVLQGLAAGDEVIIEGTQKVRDGVAVRIAPSGESPEGGV